MSMKPIYVLGLSILLIGGILFAGTISPLPSPICKLGEKCGGAIRTPPSQIIMLPLRSTTEPVIGDNAIDDMRAQQAQFQSIQSSALMHMRFRMTTITASKHLAARQSIFQSTESQFNFYMLTCLPDGTILNYTQMGGG